MYLPKLTRRILLLVIASLLPLVFGYAAILAASVRSGHLERLRLTQTRARILAQSLELHLERNLVWLGDIALGLSFGESSMEILSQENPCSMLAHGLFLTDAQGNVTASYPETGARKLAPEVIARLKVESGLGRPFVSSLKEEGHTGRISGFLFAPIRKNAGKVSGWVGGELDPQDPTFVRLLEAGKAPLDSFVAILDDIGRTFVLLGDSKAFPAQRHVEMIRQFRDNSNSQPARCRACHKKDAPDGVLAVAHIALTPWSVVIFSPTSSLDGSEIGLWKAFGLLGAGLLLGGLILGVGMSRSILKPVSLMIESAKRVGGGGNLSIPVPIQGNDEITVLAKGLEQTRLRLLDSFQLLQRANKELEVKVKERTMQVRSLLRKVISSQEEERKRIARELHDVILQDIATFLMRLDVLALSERRDQGRIEKMRGLLTKAMEDIRAIIQDLRPSILDDLGLDVALKWVVEKKFQDKECEVFVDVKGYSKGNLDSNLETITFRIAQEALTNVLKHAKARRVVLRLACSKSRLTLFIHDDGVGFEVSKYDEKVFSMTGSGVGLRGMIERAALIGGRLKIRSSPNKGGSHVRLSIPLEGSGIEAGG